MSVKTGAFADKLLIIKFSHTKIPAASNMTVMCKATTVLSKHYTPKIITLIVSSLKLK